MNLIILEGKENTGKTTTIHILYDLFKTNSAVISSPKISLSNNDFEVIIEYEEKKIAILSRGDYSNEIAEKIRCYNQQGCDIFIFKYYQHYEEQNCNLRK